MTLPATLQRAWPWIIFAAILVVGGYLRFYRLAVSPLAEDQSILYSIALDWVNQGRLPLAANKASAGVMNPPFIEYLIGLPLFVQKSVLAPLWFQAGLSLLAVGFAGWLAWRLWGAGTALLLTLFFAVNPWAVYYSRLIWNPSPIPVFATFLLAALLLLLIRRRAVFMPLLFVCLAILTQLHLSSLVLLPTIALILLLFHRRLRLIESRRLWGGVAAGAGLFTLLYLPYLVYQQSVNFVDVRALLGLLSGEEMSALAAIDEVQVSAASFLLMLELASGDHFLANQVAGWQAAVFNVPLLVGLMRLATVGALLYAFVRPAWRWRSRRQLSDTDVALLAGGLWAVVPTLLYVRHTHYLQNYFFLYLLPPLFLLIALFLREGAVWLSRRGQLWGGLLLAPFLLLAGWQALMFQAGLKLAGEEDILRLPAAGDVQRAADQLIALHRQEPACDVTVLTEGYQLATSPLGLLDPLLYPVDVKIAAQGRGFIIPAGCTFYLAAQPDPLAQSQLAAHGRLLAQQETARGVWEFYRLEAAGIEPVGEPQSARWQNGLALTAAQASGTWEGNGRLELVYTWHISRPPPPGVQIHFFNHLFGPDGQLAAQEDAAAVHPDYWRAGDQLLTQFSLQLPAELPAGDYSLLVGLYTWPDIERIPLEDGSTAYPVMEVFSVE